jgi:hypothetical protein
MIKIGKDGAELLRLLCMTNIRSKVMKVRKVLGRLQLQLIYGRSNFISLLVQGKEVFVR